VKIILEELVFFLWKAKREGGRRRRRRRICGVPAMYLCPTD
jgi:hypothetical protein